MRSSSASPPLSSSSSHALCCGIFRNKSGPHAEEQGSVEEMSQERTTACCADTRPCLGDRGRGHSTSYRLGYGGYPRRLGAVPVAATHHTATPGNEHARQDANTSGWQSFKSKVGAGKACITRSACPCRKRGRGSSPADLAPAVLHELSNFRRSIHGGHTQPLTCRPEMMHRGTRQVGPVVSLLLFAEPAALC